MALKAGTVDIDEDGGPVGDGYAMLLFTLRVQDLESNVPNPIGIPKLGDTAPPYDPRFPVDAGAVQRATDARTATLKAIAKDCTQVASWVTYLLAATGPLGTGAQATLVSVSSRLTSNSWVAFVIPTRVGGSNYAPGLWVIEAIVHSRTEAVLAGTPDPDEGAGYQLRRYHWRPSQTGGLALDEGQFVSLRDPDGDGNELQLVPPGIAGPDTVTDPTNWRILTRRGFGSSVPVRYNLTVRVVDGIV